jgi:hypothetical protein
MNKLVAVLVSLAMPLQLFAATEINFDAGRTSAAWLKQSTDARTSALGDAGRGTSRDVNAISSNPAGLGGLETQQFAFMHSVLVEDMSMEHVAYGLKIGDSRVLALSVDYMNFGDIKSYSVDNGVLTEEGSITPTGYSATLAVAHNIGALSYGLGAKIVSETLDADATNAFAFDAGLQYGFGDVGRIGLSSTNIGGNISDHNLPSTTTLGVLYGRPAGNSVDWALMADANFPAFALDSTAISYGLEITAVKNYSLRAGYKTIGNEGASGFTAGAGLTVSKFTIDYAFVDQGDLGRSNQVSLLARF